MAPEVRGGFAEGDYVEIRSKNVFGYIEEINASACTAFVTYQNFSAGYAEDYEEITWFGGEFNFSDLLLIEPATDIDDWAY